MKNWKNLHTSTALFFLLFFCINCVNAQKWGNRNTIVGEGPVVEKTIDVPSFTGVNVTFSGDVVFKQGRTQSVRVVGQQNIIDNISTNVKDGYWRLGFRDNVRKMEKLKVYITVPTLDKVVLSGSGDIDSDGSFNNLGDLVVGLSGSGNIDLDVSAKAVKCKLSGSGNIELAGSASSQTVQISGSGNVRTYELSTSSCEVGISGSGNCKLNVSNDLDVRISGSGSVNYKGSPRVNTKISGSGSVSAR